MIPFFIGRFFRKFIPDHKNTPFIFGKEPVFEGGLKHERKALGFGRLGEECESGEESP